MIDYIWDFENVTKWDRNLFLVVTYHRFYLKFLGTKSWSGIKDLGLTRNQRYYYLLSLIQIFEKLEYFFNVKAFALLDILTHKDNELM